MHEPALASVVDGILVEFVGMKLSPTHTPVTEVCTRSWVSIELLDGLYVSWSTIHLVPSSAKSFSSSLFQSSSKSSSSLLVQTSSIASLWFLVMPCSKIFLSLLFKPSPKSFSSPLSQASTKFPSFSSSKLPSSLLALPFKSHSSRIFPLSHFPSLSHLQLNLRALNSTSALQLIGSTLGGGVSVFL